jgi:hypothetical protein
MVDWGFSQLRIMLEMLGNVCEPLFVDKYPENAQSLHTSLSRAHSESILLFSELRIEDHGALNLKLDSVSGQVAFWEQLT